MFELCFLFIPSDRKPVGIKKVYDEFLLLWYSSFCNLTSDLLGTLIKRPQSICVFQFSVRYNSLLIDTSSRQSVTHFELVE